MQKTSFRPLDLAYIGASAALITLGAWVSIPATIPFTLQTLAVFAVLALFGGKNGFFAVLTYLLLGAVGIPVFSGFKGGLGALIGNTGGYLLGFLLLAAVFWLLTGGKSPTTLKKALALAAGLLVCYAFGTAWFLFIYIRTNGAVTLMSVLGMCVFPFLLPDAVKLAAALFLSAKVQRYIK